MENCLYLRCLVLKKEDLLDLPLTINFFCFLHHGSFLFPAIFGSILIFFSPVVVVVFLKPYIALDLCAVTTCMFTSLTISFLDKHTLVTSLSTYRVKRLNSVRKVTVYGVYTRLSVVL